MAEAAYSIGATLAQFQTFKFSRPGPIRNGSTSESECAIPVSETFEKCLNTGVLENRPRPWGKGSIARVRFRLVTQITTLDQATSLVHGDFGARNTVVKRVGGRWVATGILDWELAFSGSPLWDAARFTCFERRARPLREPHFSRGFSENGGLLPENWLAFSRIMNMVSSTESLSRPDLPDAFVPELKNLIVATTDGSDPG